MQVDDRGKSTAVDQTTPSCRHQVNLDIILGIYHDRKFLLISFFVHTIASKSKQCFIYLCCRHGIRFMKHHINTLYRMRSPSWWKIVKLEGIQTHWGCYRRPGKNKMRNWFFWHWQFHKQKRSKKMFNCCYRDIKNWK